MNPLLSPTRQPRRRPFALPGDRADQRRNLKLLVRALRRFETERRKQAARAAETASKLEHLDVRAIESNPHEARKALAGALSLDCGVCGRDEIGEALKRLTGTDSDYIVDQVLRRGRDLAAVVAESERWNNNDEPADERESQIRETPTVADILVAPTARELLNQIVQAAAEMQAQSIFIARLANALDELPIDEVSDRRASAIALLQKIQATFHAIDTGKLFDWRTTFDRVAVCCGLLLGDVKIDDSGDIVDA